MVGHTREIHAGPSELVLAVISTAIALAGIGLAFFIYLSGRIDWPALRARLSRPRRALERGFFVNDLYSGGLVAPGKLGAAFAAYVVDLRFIDGAINGLGRLFAAGASAGRRIQTGFVRTYAVGLLLGTVGILWYLAVRF